MQIFEVTRNISNILHKIAEAFMEDYRNHSHAGSTWVHGDIDGGDCANFSAVACILLNGKIKIFSTKKKGGHVFFRYNNLYYDASHQSGVKTIRDIDKDYAEWDEEDFDQPSLDELKKMWKLKDFYIKRIIKLSGIVM